MSAASAIVEQPGSSLATTSVHAITHTKSMSLHKSRDSTHRKPPTTCWQCGDLAFHSVHSRSTFIRNDISEGLTINTHRGLFQFTRLPFRVQIAPIIFQKTMDTMLTGTKGATTYLNDIIVTGSNPDELIQRLETVLSQIQDYGFRLCLDKCNFFMPTVKYLGFIIDQDGRHPDLDNKDFIKEMPPPKDVNSLRVFLSLMSHCGSFLPDMHRLRPPMNKLLKKDVKWIWSRECQ
ncbi:unnamed protein product [Schistocephalus solidus]|uniref:Reverse transcriptase domain-containing protein n=1 Tax=Schistocephalus solidus TaxID=70667 RepID=A0A183TBE2_SCHSO|nr:unnamed protein product [Schistocephalus solidus]